MLDPKERVVVAAPFHDRVVHHALVRVIEPVFEKRFIEDRFACRRGKGTHAAMRQAAESARRFPFALGFSLSPRPAPPAVMGPGREPLPGLRRRDDFASPLTEATRHFKVGLRLASRATLHPRMSVWSLVCKELSYRRTNFALSLLGVGTTVALFVAFLVTSEAARRETVRVTRDLGFNLRIIPRETDMDRFWALGYSEQTLPEDAVQRLAAHPRVFVAFNHLVATLQRRFPLADREVLLTGVAPAVTAPEQRNRPMGYAVKPGTLIAGFRVAQRLGLKPRSPLTLGGQDFVVERCLAESGTEEDIRLYTALGDAQRLLGLPGRISEIQAIDCLCLTADQDPLSRLRAELKQALPEATVVQLRTLADARAKQRQTAERYFAQASPFLLIVCAGWVALLAALNARERRLELGVLHALGHTPLRLAALFLVRAVLLGVLAAALGWAAGTVLALRVGPDVFRVTANAIVADFALLGYALVAAPLFTCLATLLPTLHAVTLDPAVILREA